MSRKSRIYVFNGDYLNGQYSPAGWTVLIKAQRKYAMTVATKLLYDPLNTKRTSFTSRCPHDTMRYPDMAMNQVKYMDRSKEVGYRDFDISTLEELEL